MKDTFESIYQFKISLKNSKPTIWRRIQVPENYSFWDLHTAIQDAMGWMDCHLHQFSFTIPPFNIRVDIGLPEDNEYLHSTRVKIKKYFLREKVKANYWYDFGDDWHHTILLEKILPRDHSQNYPLCLAGKMACPPEDCGGIWNYYHNLKVLSDPNHPEYQDTIEWMGDKFDPVHFDPKEVEFDDPKERWKLANRVIF